MMNPIQYFLDAAPFRFQVLCFRTLDDLNTFISDSMATVDEKQFDILPGNEISGLTSSGWIDGAPQIDICLPTELSMSEAIDVVAHEVFHANLCMTRLLQSKAFSFAPVNIVNTVAGVELYAACMRGETPDVSAESFSEEEFFAARQGTFTSQVFHCLYEAKKVFEDMGAGVEKAIRWYEKNSPKPTAVMLAACVGS